MTDIVAALRAILPDLVVGAEGQHKPLNKRIRWTLWREMRNSVLSADVLVDASQPEGALLDPARFSEQKWWESKVGIPDDTPEWMLDEIVRQVRSSLAEKIA